MTDDVSPTGSAVDDLVVTAVALSVVVPGLGHVYVRRWRRGVAWLVVTLASFVPLSVPSILDVGLSSWTIAVLASPDAVAALPVLAALAVGGRVLVAADVWLVVRRNRERAGVTRCSACSRDVDEELSFCHYCLDDD